MMELSDEQMACVTGVGIGQWAPMDRPVGPQPLPAWIAGAHVNWMDGAANAPTVKLKVRGDVYAWDDQRWASEVGGCYIARHDDGRARVLYHTGPVSHASAWRIFTGKGKPFTYRWIVPERIRCDEAWASAAVREGQKHLDSIQAPADWQLTDPYSGEPVDRAACQLEVKNLRVTTQQSGFGGDAYLLTMLDGFEVMLRGPWHGGAPAGYVEVTTYDITQPTSKWDRVRPWFKRGGRGGLYVTEDLYLRILSRYAAHALLARVHHSYGWRVEPYRAEWGEPKAGIYELERARAVALASSSPTAVRPSPKGQRGRG